MPELSAYPEKPQSLIELSEHERLARADENTAAWKYYDGDMRKPLKIKPGQPG